MEQLIDWVERHWLTVFLAGALLVAAGFVFVYRKSLFYKE